MKITFFEPDLIHKNTANSWKELYNILAAYGVMKECNNNNVNEYEYETFVKNLDSRTYRSDRQKETDMIIIKYLDVNIQIEKISLTA